MSLFQLPDLSTLYSKPYDTEQLRWRRHGALNKAANITALVKPYQHQIKDVLEVGCGTGHVLKAIKNNGIGSTFAGLEISSERSTPDPALLADNIHIRAFDGRVIPYADGTFDLVYATHVLEHVLDPRGFLAELRRVTKHFVVVEVPCELHLRTSHRALQTSLDIGHINCFTPASFSLMLETSGLQIQSLRTFEPTPYLSGRGANRLLQRAKSWLRRQTLNISAPVAHRLFTYHVAALCRPGRELVV